LKQTMNPQVPGTLEAAAFDKMTGRGRVAGALIDGPPGLGTAIGLECRRH
jgi:hypothetical protein